DVRQEILRLALEDLGGRGRHFLVQRGETLLCERHQPDAVALVRAAIPVASAAQQRRVKIVELRSACQRIEPDVLVALALLDRPQAKPALQEESERTSRGAFELR